MAKLIKRKRLDIKAYDQTVSESSGNTLYGSSWYLDALLGNYWGAIVANDYQWVMPLPYSRNYRFFFRKRVMQPMFCQQLGVFGKMDDITNFPVEFLDLFHSSKPYNYQFNSVCRSFLETNNIAFKERKNYILPLDKDYKQINKAYSTNLIRNLKKAEKLELEFRTATDENSWFDFLEIKMKQLRLHRQKRWTQRMGRVMKSILNLGKGYFAVVSKDETILAMAFMIEHKGRLVYLFAVKTPDGGKMGANHFLIDQIIRNEIAEGRTLDFEGSDVEGVERFFKSFGAVNEPYFSLML